jgi:hypothetical protein
MIRTTASTSQNSIGQISTPIQATVVAQHSRKKSNERPFKDSFDTLLRAYFSHILISPVLNKYHLKVNLAQFKTYLPTKPKALVAVLPGIEPGVKITILFCVTWCTAGHVEIGNF